jgi:hypothetical protein
LICAAVEHSRDEMSAIKADAADSDWIVRANQRLTMTSGH